MIIELDNFMNFSLIFFLQFLYDNESQVIETDKIWRAKEVDSLQKNCNSMSDIYVSIHFVASELNFVWPTQIPY